jgi:hypothetical protein
MTWPELLTVVVALLSLLWSATNAAQLRKHDQALKVSEAHLRVTSELKLRLHQQAWDLLKETHTAAFAAFDALRNYQIRAIQWQRTESTATPLWGDEHQKAMVAVQTFSAFAHVSPPDKQQLRDAASAFSKAFNMVNDSVLGGALPDTQMAELMRVITEALGTAAAGTKGWNEELWRHQSVSALARFEP